MRKTNKKRINLSHLRKLDFLIINIINLNLDYEKDDIHPDSRIEAEKNPQEVIAWVFYLYLNRDFSHLLANLCLFIQQ